MFALSYVVISLLMVGTALGGYEVSLSQGWIGPVDMDRNFDDLYNPWGVGFLLTALINIIPAA